MTALAEQLRKLGFKPLLTERTDWLRNTGYPEPKCSVTLFADVLGPATAKQYGYVLKPHEVLLERHIGRPWDRRGIQKRRHKAMKHHLYIRPTPNGLMPVTMRPEQAALVL